MRTKKLEFLSVSKKEKKMKIIYKLINDAPTNVLLPIFLELSLIHSKFHFRIKSESFFE